jgi:hypothetical protein
VSFSARSLHPSLTRPVLLVILSLASMANAAYVMNTLTLAFNLVDVAPRQAMQWTIAADSITLFSVTL